MRRRSGALVEGGRVLVDVDAVGDHRELVRVHADAFSVVGDCVADGDDGLALRHDQRPERAFVEAGHEARTQRHLAQRADVQGRDHGQAVALAQGRGDEAGVEEAWCGRA